MNMSKDCIGYRLRTIRKFLNLNQDTVSEKMNITKQTLSRYENSTRFPDSIFLQHFGKIFKVNANWLLYGVDDMFLEDYQNPDPGESTLKTLQFLLKKIEEIFMEKKG